MNRFNQQRRPFLIPIWLLGISAFAVFLFACASAWVLWFWWTADATILVVAGRASAAAVERMLGGIEAPGQLNAVYFSALDENGGLPVAAAAAPRGVLSTDPPRVMARHALHDHAGGRILLLVDEAAIPDVLSALTGRSDIANAAQPHTAFLVTVPRVGESSVLRITY